MAKLTRMAVSFQVDAMPIRGKKCLSLSQYSQEKKRLISGHFTEHSNPLRNLGITCPEYILSSHTTQSNHTDPPNPQPPPPPPPTRRLLGHQHAWSFLNNIRYEPETAQLKFTLSLKYFWHIQCLWKLRGWRLSAVEWADCQASHSTSRAGEPWQGGTNLSCLLNSFSRKYKKRRKKKPPF